MEVVIECIGYILTRANGPWYDLIARRAKSTTKQNEFAGKLKICMPVFGVK